MALHLPIESLKTKSAVGRRRYRDANPVPTSLQANGIAIVASGPVFDPWLVNCLMLLRSMKTVILFSGVYFGR